MVFVPKRVIFEREALEYPLGKKLFGYFKDKGTETSFTSSHNRVTGIPGKTRAEGYFEGKRTLVVGVRRIMTFEKCRPSAHFQLPLATSCPGKCKYCYLMTNLGKKPYLRVYVNVEEILSSTRGYIEKRIPGITVFEGAATSDPLPVVDEESRTFKFGQFGYGKYVYARELYQEINAYFAGLVKEFLPGAQIEYLV